jgi:hypothetical protein
VILALETAAVTLRAMLAAAAGGVGDWMRPGGRPHLSLTGSRAKNRRGARRQRCSPELDAAIDRIVDQYHRGEFSHAELVARIRALPGGPAWWRGDPDAPLAHAATGRWRSPAGRLLTFEEILDGLRRASA